MRQSPVCTPIDIYARRAPKRRPVARNPALDKRAWNGGKVPELTIQNDLSPATIAFATGQRIFSPSSHWVQREKLAILAR
jgi:hypothetical protein